jgi:RHS repeat-associated protein
VLTTNLGTTTTYFIGAHHEVTHAGAGQADGVVTKYYYAGAQRIAMRKGTDLYYLIGDHLGSTSIVTDANGTVVSEMRYKAWGEVRHESGASPTEYTYTGQYSYTADFGLMFYNARWYDSSLGRFAQADTIIPSNQGVQAWDRFAYANNNPVRYVDPDGHFPIIPFIALVGSFFIFNGTSDTYQPNLSHAELQSRQASVELGISLIVTAYALKVPIVEVASNLFDCANGFCDPNLMLPGSAAGYANAAEEVVDDADVLVARTYTFGDESFEYTFNPNKPAALGYSEDIAHLSTDDYNLLRVPDNIYANTNIQKDFMRDIVESRIKPDLFSNPDLFKNRVFSYYEARLLRKLEGIFGQWYE